MRERECPKCGKPMQRQDEYASVGIGGLWYCDVCDYAEPLEDDDEPDVWLT